MPAIFQTIVRGFFLNQDSGRFVSKINYEIFLLCYVI